MWSQEFDSKAVVRELNGLLPIVDLLKSEYAAIQSIALTALQLITEDGQSAFALSIWNVFNTTRNGGMV